MPKITLEINEIEKTINRPVVLQVVEDIKRITSYPKEASCFYKGFASQTVNKESVMGDKEIERVDFSHRDRIIISGVKKYTDQSVYRSQPYKRSFNPILYDKENRIILSPLNYEVEVDVSLNFFSKDRLTLEQWSSNLRRKIGQSIKAYQHRIDYTYPIPNKLIEILHHLFETKIKLVPREGDFTDWIEEIALMKLTGVTNQIGEGLLAVVEQSQIGVLGLWKLTEAPEISKTESGDVYQATLNYTIRYYQPTALTLEYPIIVNNTIISRNYRPPCDYNDPLSFGVPEKLQWGLNYLTDSLPKYYPSEPIILPCFDEWRPDRLPLGTALVYQALITVDPEDRQYVMNIADLGEEYKLSQWLVDMIYLFHSDVTILGTSPVLIALYRNQNISEYEIIRLTKDLRLYTNEPMELYNEYHISLSLITDLSLLTENAIEKLRKNGRLANELFKALNLGRTDDLPKILPDGSLQTREMWNFISKLNDTHPMYKNNIEVRNLTVSNCIVTTRRLEDAIS